jgi:hypothetical protein
MWIHHRETEGTEFDKEARKAGEVERVIGLLGLLGYLGYWGTWVTWVDTWVINPTNTITQ